MDRRAIFFVCAAVVCGLLIPVTPDEFRYVGVILVVAYLVLAALSLADHRSRHGTFR